MSDVETTPSPTTSERAKPRRKPDFVRNVEREIEAARVIRDQVAALAEGDADFIRDTLEGEVDFEALAEKLVASIGEDEAHAEGLKAYQAALSKRAAAFETRSDFKRALLLSALEISGRPSIVTASGTVSSRPTPPKAVVTEPSDIPAEFWKPQPPKIDLRALLDALKGAAADGRTIPGATLSNGSTSLSIRRA